MEFDSRKKYILQQMGIDLYQSKERRDLSAQAIVEKNSPNYGDSGRAKIIQCRFKNQRPFLLVAEWENEHGIVLTELCHKIIFAIGQKQEELLLLTDADLSSQPILVFGNACVPMILEINPSAIIYSTYSLYELYKQPELKRIAWQVMKDMST